VDDVIGRHIGCIMMFVVS